MARNRQQKRRNNNGNTRPQRQDAIPLLDRPLSYRIGVAAERDLLNSAFRRGVLEGQKHIMQELARLVEAYLVKHDFVSDRGDLELCRQQVDFYIPNPRNPSEKQQICR